MASTRIKNVRFEHYRPGEAIGVDDVEPRLSWQFVDTPADYQQEEYEIQLNRVSHDGVEQEPTYAKVSSASSQLVPWPGQNPIRSFEKYAARVRARGEGDGQFTPWSESATIETSILSRDDWKADLISAPWANSDPEVSKPEDLFRRKFSLSDSVQHARLCVTAQGLYEAEINGRKVGDAVLSPGWQVYDKRLAFQTYDVTEYLVNENVIGIRVAEGWFNGRLGFRGGRRNHWGDRTGVLAQLEVTLADGKTIIIGTNEDWTVTKGPTQLAEIYDGEKYDATAEVADWSHVNMSTASGWDPVVVLPPLPTEVQLMRGSSESVRCIETLNPVEQISTPSGKTVLDFGQNLVGHIRLNNVKGPRGHVVTLSHAEVLEDGELGTRPLRVCKAQDKYTFKGDTEGETYAPRFTFHGFRFAQIDDWPAEAGGIMDSLEAVVCHTDMEEQGHFSCSNDMLNKLYQNTKWGMRGNFLSVPTDCPQRDERLGWTGDLAVFAPTATFIYGCYGIVKDWLQDLWLDQQKLDGLPPMISPNTFLGHPIFGKDGPTAVWHDATILVPWALFEETKDLKILERQYQSMTTWLDQIPKNKDRSTHLWLFSKGQLGDWLDPNAPPNDPRKAMTDPVLVANAFLVHSLQLMVRIATILGKDSDASAYRKLVEVTRAEFTAEYVSPNGRLVSDTQTAYALSICFNLLSDSELVRAGERLADIVQRNNFRVSTGFAGTPFICEALYRVRRTDVAYAMLLNETCPSWLYPITMGATTMWERWDSMLPDGRINPGQMTSFNHYAYGAVVKFMVERLAGLQALEPGWKRSKAHPIVEGPFTWAKAQHHTPYGTVMSSWALSDAENEGGSTLKIEVVVPPCTSMVVVIPGPHEDRVEVVGSGSWSFSTPYTRRMNWPVKLSDR